MNRSRKSALPLLTTHPGWPKGQTRTPTFRASASLTRLHRLAHTVRSHLPLSRDPSEGDLGSSSNCVLHSGVAVVGDLLADGLLHNILDDHVKHLARLEAPVFDHLGDLTDEQEERSVLEEVHRDVMVCDDHENVDRSEAERHVLLRVGLAPVLQEHLRDLLHDVARELLHHGHRGNDKPQTEGTNVNGQSAQEPKWLR